MRHRAAQTLQIHPALCWLLGACALWNLEGCYTEAIMVPRQLLRETEMVDRAEVAATASVPAPAQIGTPDEQTPPATFDQKSWLNEILANNNGQISLRDSLMIAFANSEVVRTVSGPTGFSQVGATQYDIPGNQERLQIEQARFDPIANVGYIGSQIRQPPNSYFGPGIVYDPKQDEGDLFGGITKPTVTGGSISASYYPPLGYLYYPGGGVSGFNPAYTAQVIFTAQQPLLRGAGSEVNLAPIRVAQLKKEQSAMDVKTAMLAQVRSVEEAYWDLQASCANLQAIDFLLPLLKEAVRIEEVRHENQIVTEGELARSRMLLNQFEQQRVQLSTDVTNKQYRLANLMGVSRADVISFIPIDPPERERQYVNPQESLELALKNRPDLIKQQIAVQIRDLNVLVAGNQAKPQVDLQALWRTTGLAERLDTALGQMADFKFNDWTLGATCTVPLGLRAARAAHRASEFDYAREMAILRQAVSNVEFQLAEIAREMDRAWNEFTLATKRIDQTHEWLVGAAIRFEQPPPQNQNGMPGGGAGLAQQSLLTVLLNDYQQAMRAYVDAVVNASQALARYNSQIARLEEAQGSLLDKRNISVSDLAAPAVGPASKRKAGESPHSVPGLVDSTPRPEMPRPPFRSYRDYPGMSGSAQSRNALTD